MRTLLFSCLYCCLLSPWLWAAEHEFSRHSLAEIERQHQGQAFLLLLWSADCPPCRQELALIARLRNTGYKFNLVLLATDPPVLRNELTHILQQHQLHNENNWFFSHEPPERLRYQVDPQWFGELPRSYFYDAQHQRMGISGKLQQEMIKAWINNTGQ